MSFAQSNTYIIPPKTLGSTFIEACRIIRTVRFRVVDRLQERHSRVNHISLCPRVGGRESGDSRLQRIVVLLDRSTFGLNVCGTSGLDRWTELDGRYCQEEEASGSRVVQGLGLVDILIHDLTE